MPKFGSSNARGAARKPRTSTAAKNAAKAGKTTGFPKGQNRSTASTSKSREDGRGGRSPKREYKLEERTTRAPRTRGAFFEERPKKTYGEPRDERPARGGSRFERDERPARGARGERSERTERTERTERGARDNRRDWSPRGNEGTGRAAKKTWGARDERPARGSRDERPARGGSRFERDERPARGGSRFERDERPARATREPRAERSGFGDRNRSERAPFKRDERRDDRPARSSYGRDDRTRFEERNARRPDRVERDNSRESTFRGARDANPNKKAFFEDKVLDRLESVEQSEAITSNTFEEMNLHPRILTALQGMGAEVPFPIQESTIPAAIGGMDVLGRGKTGSGKTIAFTVPLVTKLVAAGSVPRKPGKPRALILAPTRELADQIDRTVNGIARAVGFYTTCIYGGVPQRKQENAMIRGVDIVVATPGRLEDLISQRIVDLSEVETLVVDEADHMCDLGFIEGVRRIMRATGDSQKLLFSATLDREVDALVKEFLPAPYVYEVPNEESDTANIEHRVMVVDTEDRS
ncbi:MAG: DEAD/DEAH box helicase, partial [Rhodoluna sp.]